MDPEPTLSDFQCQNCGAALQPRIAQARVIECAQCGSTSIWVDEAFRVAGERGILHDSPGLIALGQSFYLAATSYTAIGHCQFSYGAGFWDEFWCIDGAGRGMWLSVDEGDYALEKPLKAPDGRYALGQSAEVNGRNYRVVEKDIARCTAFRGELPEVLELNEAHEYIDFAGPGRRMATLERWDGGHAWTCGHWYSAWDVQKL